MNQIPLCIGTSTDGRLMAWVTEESLARGLVDLKEVGGLGEYRKLDLNVSNLEPVSLATSAENDFAAVAMPGGSILVFDLKSQDKDTHVCQPLARLKHSEEVAALGFAGTRTDDTLLLCRGLSGSERSWTLTRFIRDRRRE